MIAAMLSRLNSISFTQVRTWLAKGFWAVAEQGLFAVSNFAMTLLLARWLTPIEYGTFSTAYTIFLLVGTFHTSFVTEPILIFGPGRYKDSIPEYIKGVLHTHSVFSALTSLVLLLMSAGAYVLKLPTLAPIWVGLAISGPFILLLWLARRVAYVQAVPLSAAVGGALYLVLMVLGLGALYLAGFLSVVSALLVMALASFLASVGVLLPSLRQTGYRVSETWRDIASRHWSFGRWTAATNLLAWVTGNVYYLVLPSIGGFQDSGALRATMNLIMPIVLATQALTMLLKPILVRAKGTGETRRIVVSLLIAFGVGSIVFWFVLLFFRTQLMGLLYGPQYSRYSDLVCIVGFIPVASGGAAVLSSAFQAEERLKPIFWAQMWSALAAVFFGLIALFVWGIYGAAAGLLMSWVTLEALLLIRFFRAPVAVE